MAIRNVILDWSGTLFDDLTPVLRTTNHVFETFGMTPLSLDEFRADFCLPLKKFYERRIPQVDQRSLEETFMAHYPQHRHEIRPLAQAASFLAYCREQGISRFIASTVDPDTYHSQMDRYDLSALIDKPYLGIEDKTLAIHQILEENELDRRETIFVGDMEHDIEAGRAGGVLTCAVLTGYSNEGALRAMAPDLVCADLDALRDHLASNVASYG